LAKGSISGVKGRCRVTVENLAWDKSAHTASSVIRSDIDQSITLIERDGIDGIKTDATVSDSPLGPIARVIQLKAGVSTPITLELGKLRPHLTNLALHQPATASSDDGKNLATAVTDDDIGTRWSSKNADDQWIYVDLGSVQKITKVRLDWETAAGKDYDIEVSDDGLSWTTVKSVIDNTKTGWVEYPDLNTSGRYVRINGKTRITKYGFSLWEIQVFGG